MGKFREYLESMNNSFVIEAFDTSYKINKKEKINAGGNITTLYYIDINSKKYRVFVEESKDEIEDKPNINLHIGFEYYDEVTKDFTIKGLHTVLGTKEVLGLFGTVLKILKTIAFDNIMVCSGESKKFRLYLRMVERLAKEFNIKNVTHNDECIFMFNSDYKPSFKFKYKIKL